MVINGLILCVALFVILGGSAVFTNALEHLGEYLGLSTGVTGSVLAAVGTALPETAVPIVAVLTGQGAAAHEIGVGAILGAPLMLSTLAFFLLGVMALLRRGLRGSIHPEPTGFRRDLRFFLLAFVIAVAALYVPHQLRWVRALFAVALILVYVFYLWRTLGASKALVSAGHGTEADKPLFMSRIGLSDALPIMLLQLAVGVGLIVAGARGFVIGISAISYDLGLSPLFLALAIVPFATELPEKMNSLLWVARRQDTLAIGNVTGALVFQSTLLPALGVLLTPWEPRFDVRLAMGVTLLAGAWLLMLTRAKRMLALALLVNGVTYGVYFLVLLWHG